MANQKALTIGLFGFGVVGEGLYKVLHQTPSLQATIKKVCIRDATKKRNAPAELFTTNKDELLNDEAINVIVEVIDDSVAAYEIVTTAAKNGKAVVSASKKMLADNLPAILQLQKDYKVPFLYEAAACASIPVIRNLEEYYDNDLLHSIRAIVNGSTNFILTKMFKEQLDFFEALTLAQQLGFAESNPALDVNGHDAVNKWTLLLNHAYGIVEQPANLLFSGIQNIKLNDAQYARKNHLDIKLVAQAKKLQSGQVAAFVLPQFVQPGDHLAFVKNEYNGVVIESGFADKQFFYGKGAGSFPTASAVLSDISALRYDYTYEYKKLNHPTRNELATGYYLRVYVSFEDWKHVPRDAFETIEEWHKQGDRIYLVGVIEVSKLQQSTWWKENATSLILTADGVIEHAASINKENSAAILTAV
ncbi:homoserine dehydrogenase [Aridibaculum aurantiacum]|uniref:homoserine dehydrogenase n=1 Tax=Aridibaculum aurantiacum TaxID=2810307 RepID=UPI001A95DBA1|nr:homoserine dehydrogenase [Aridibaculum aurantiacum]